MSDGHDGDCTIYSALYNNNDTDGICTCGYWRRSGLVEARYSTEIEQLVWENHNENRS